MGPWVLINANWYKIGWANATRKIPLPRDSVEVLYSSHMLEHLDRVEARLFLREVKRVLEPGGIVRLVVPDIALHVRKYAEGGDADLFLEETYMCVSRPRGIAAHLRAVLVGARHHHWMYDEKSLCKLLRECGFDDPIRQSAGSTRIRDPGPLDLSEREDESLYVEARKV